MGDLTSAGAGGLGTAAARWALIVAWGMGVLSDAFGGVFQSLLGLPALSAALGLAGAVVLTSRGDRSLSPPASAFVACACVLSAVAALASDAPLGGIWSFNFAAYTAALLLPRGNVLPGTVASISINVLGLAWAVQAGATTAQMVDMLALPFLALFIGAAWRFMLTRVVARELSHDREAARAAMEREAADASIAAIQGELDQIRHEVGPALRAIRDATSLTPELSAGISVVEANLRDRIRSPEFGDPTLRDSIDRARQRGVDVVLLGSSAQEDRIAAPLAAALVEVLEGSESGSVTVRSLPRDRLGCVSVLLAQPGRSERLLLDADGAILARR